MYFSREKKFWRTGSVILYISNSTYSGSGRTVWTAWTEVATDKKTRTAVLPQELTLKKTKQNRKSAGFSSCLSKCLTSTMTFVPHSHQRQRNTDWIDLYLINDTWEEFLSSAPRSMASWDFQPHSSGGRLFSCGLASRWCSLHGPCHSFHDYII